MRRKRRVGEFTAVHDNIVTNGPTGFPHKRRPIFLKYLQSIFRSFSIPFYN